jgi:hypothetical protein
LRGAKADFRDPHAAEILEFYTTEVPIGDRSPTSIRIVIAVGGLITLRAVGAVVAVSIGRVVERCVGSLFLGPLGPTLGSSILFAFGPLGPGTLRLTTCTYWVHTLNPS